MPAVHWPALWHTPLPIARNRVTARLARVRYTGAVHDDPGEPPPLTTRRMLARAGPSLPPVQGRAPVQTMVHHGRAVPALRFRLERIEGHWIGALGMNTMVSFGAVLVAVLVAFASRIPTGRPPPGSPPSWPWRWLCRSPSKTLWSAIDLAMRPLEPEDDVDPRYIPGSRHREA